jgi:hypothetical protein
MPIIAAIAGAVSILFVLHVVQTGRPRWWILVILAAPVLGPLCYVLFEVIPGTPGAHRAQRSVDAALKRVSRTLAPDAELQRRIDELERCESVQNKLKLANECMESGRPHDAARIYRDCLAGVYRDDPTIQYSLLEALIVADEREGARRTAEHLLAQHPGFREPEVRFALARVHEREGDANAAEGIYHQIVPHYPGEAARYHYARLLWSRGRVEQAKALLATILANAERSSALYRDKERAWIKAARRDLAA